MPRRHHTRSEQGQTMVEFTMIVPLMLILIFAVIQFGIVYNNYISITDAARVGARKAAVSRQTSTPAALAEEAARKSAPNLKAADLEIDVNATVWAPGADVTVEARYPYEINLFGFVVASGMLESQTTERIE